MNALLALSIAILAGLLMTRVIKLIRMPDVTAYLIAGLLLGPYCLNVLSEEMSSSLAFISEIALGFIAYSIGAEFKLSYLKQIGIKPIVITCFESVFASGIVFGALLLFGADMPLALALGAIAAATAPAATLMVIRQYKANGPVSRMLLPVVAMDDATGLMLFAIMSSIAQAIVSGASMTIMNLAIVPVCQIVGSLGLGIGIGALLVFILKMFHSRGKKLALTIMVVFAGVGLSSLLNLSSLLVCMMIGAAMVNMEQHSDVMLEQCDRFTPPLFLLFFVLSGADLDLKVLLEVGVIGAVYVIARVIGKVLGATTGSLVEHCDKNIVKYLGLTLIPQAGVAIGMARLSATALPSYSHQITAVVLAGTLIYELTGPLITKIALTKAGEIKTEARKPKPAKAAN